MSRLRLRRIIWHPFRSTKEDRREALSALVEKGARVSRDDGTGIRMSGVKSVNVWLVSWP